MIASLYDKLIEKYSDTESPDTVVKVIQHILNQEGRKDDLFTTINHQFLDKLEYRQLINLFNNYKNSEPIVESLKKSIETFFRNLLLNEMYEDVVMIPDIKMKKMWFYKFNNKTKTLKKIIGGSSEITEIQEYLMEKGLIKKDKMF